MGPFEIVFAPAVENHLMGLSARERRVVLDGITQFLSDQPLTETRRRKAMRPNTLAAWELRLGDLRVYYRASETPSRRVEIVAVGVKRRAEIWIGGERVEL